MTLPLSSPFAPVVHPAQRRVKKLAAERPALLVVFDLLVDERGRTMDRVAVSADATAFGRARFRRTRAR